MNGADRSFPTGDLRVSDADRDRALAELREACRVGRITDDEFDERSGQALRARTGPELSTLLADLPLTAPPAAPPVAGEPPGHAVAVRAVMGASAISAALLFLMGATHGVIGAAVIAGLLVLLIIFLHVIGADRP